MISRVCHRAVISRVCHRTVIGEAGCAIGLIIRYNRFVLSL